MKKKFSLNRLMHNDKLMMLVSLVLAILVWALVVYGPSNLQDQEITGVPISVTLNDYASQTLNLRITSGANATATVTVHGLRSVVSKLSAADITVTADTGNVIKEGTYTLALRAAANGDYSIKRIVGDNGTNDTVTISCDVWKEVAFDVEVEMPGVTLADGQNSRFGTPVIAGAAVTGGQVTLSGPRTDISRVATVVAVIDEEKAISEATAFEARLEARDERGEPITTLAFAGIEDGKVSVTVPVMVYRKIDLASAVLHAPAAYQDAKLVTVSPSYVELWGVPSEIDDYVQSVLNRIAVDFDQLSPATLKREIVLEPTEGIRPVNGSETITIAVGLKGMTTRTYEVPLSASNVTVQNCPAGYVAKVTQSVLKNVVLCGTSRQLGAIRAENIRVTVDMNNSATAGQQSIKARISVDGQPAVWAYYGETAHNTEVLISVEAQP